MARRQGGSDLSRPGLYLHIPFCERLCAYCNFARGLRDDALATRYVAAVEREIRGAGAGRPADTVFFGGGTPSLLEPGAIGRLLAACRGSFDLDPGAEITLEANPENATAPRLEAFREAGVTRLSLGVQSFDDAELARLGRLHSAARAAGALRDARAAGFDNVSLDLMFWLPGQSPSSWLATVDRAIDLGPEHLSLYLLELYPNAPLRDAMARQGAAGLPGAGVWTQAPDDAAADMYLAALERLDEAGYAQYEISNVARPGRASRHNVKYWQDGEWYGFGSAAHSTVGGVRWRNVASTAVYVDRVTAGSSVREGVRALTPGEHFEEALFTGLRLAAGVDEAGLAARHGVDPWARFRPVFEPCVADGLMWRRHGRLGLTRRGMLVANEILAAVV